MEGPICNMIESGDYNCYEFYLAATEKYGNYDQAQHMDARITRTEMIRDIEALAAYFTHELGLKRGDASAQSPADVVYCQDEAALAEAIGRFRARGVADHVVSSHVVGDVVKFYGVGSDFFRCYYPTDDGQTKFGDEHHNGPAHHYIYNKEEMHSQVVRLAAITGLEVYGGDAIVRPDGTFCIIDFNDWPSFARCRDEAAEAISQLVSKGM